MVTYLDALKFNYPIYNDGAPCVRGHPNARYVKRHVCVYCQRENTKKSTDNRNKTVFDQSFLASNGCIETMFVIHKDDLETIQNFIKGLMIERNLMSI